MIDSERQKPDAAFYRTSVLTKNTEIDKSDDGRPRFGDQLVTAEFKRGILENDAFEDTDTGVKPAHGSGKRTEVHGQLITYAECVMAVQQRLAVFMLYIIGRRCRFIRWDRSGSIVTELMDYYRNCRNDRL